jgi:hypothetical protein
MAIDPDTLTDEQLVEAFGNACLESGRSNSGLIISASAEDDWKHMRWWHRALLERLVQLRKAAEPHDP